MGVNYSEIIERMRWAGKLKNDSAVARLLGVTPQALSNYKKRGEMPTDLVLKFANLFGLSVDWLITGHGQMQRPVKGVATAERTGLSAAEESPAYCGDTIEVYKKITDFAALSPDEIICVGKLLKILRGHNTTAAKAIKLNVDALLKATEESPDAILQQTKKEE